VGSDNTNKITTKATRFEKHCYTLEIVLRDWFSVLNGKLRTENRNVRTIGLTSILDGQVKCVAHRHKQIILSITD
jgi:hypothetical protein